MRPCVRAIYTVSEKTTLFWLAITSTCMMHQPILIIFGTNVAKEVVSQMILYFPPHLISASALPGKTRKHENHTFSLKCCITAFPEFKQLLLDFFSFVDLKLIFLLA